MTPIRLSPSSLKQGRWYDYMIRFALGGAAGGQGQEHPQRQQQTQRSSYHNRFLLF
jgi:hypothetical protein